MQPNHQTIQNSYHTKGVSGLDEMIDAGASAYSLRRALRNLKEAGCVDDAVIFENHLQKRGVIRPRHKPTKPQPGETRPYRVQKGRGTKYLRLPVDGSFPSVDEGEVIFVTFGSKKIHVHEEEEV